MFSQGWIFFLLLFLKYKQSKFLRSFPLWIFRDAWRLKPWKPCSSLSSHSDVPSGLLSSGTASWCCPHRLCFLLGPVEGCPHVLAWRCFAVTDMLCLLSQPLFLTHAHIPRTFPPQVTSCRTAASARTWLELEPVLRCNGLSHRLPYWHCLPTPFCVWAAPG